MTITNLFTMLGGLGLFLYGMHMMSNGLENVAGNSLKKILEKITSNRIVGVLIGAGITAVIQSSSATTVMVVGFVNSGLMKLSQAVWIIMGANVGTTITGQLIALNVKDFAPILIFAGVFLIQFIRNKKVGYVGEIVAGLGILFVGMQFMSDAMVPLRDYKPFVDLMTTFENPFLGIAAGAVFTAVIQSSSASIGILQALAMSGAIQLHSAIFVLFGQNIGTCITSIIASIGTNRNAKRTTMIHLLFNVIGTLVFVTLCLFVPFTDYIVALTPGSVQNQIANVHTVFNIATTVMLLPFGNQLVQLVEKILPLKDDEEQDLQTLYISATEPAASFMATTQLSKEIARMFDFAKENIVLTMKGLTKVTDKYNEKIGNNEKYIDYLNTEITRFSAQVTLVDTNENDSLLTNALFKITGNIERIGDHAINLAQYIDETKANGLKYSAQAETELTILQQTLDSSISCFEESKAQLTPLNMDKIIENEELVDELIASYRENQIKRLKKGEISAEACVVYSEILTDIERIADHLYSIAKLCRQFNITLYETISE
ncbi:Na/Pi cotransporter family protein [Beduini massiliensis]|uniref:Na/Pi cotransporter family protein n=1 Tax=Beduini massiliensis TaxID=1585974 RepID=UPI00059A87B1|nr:Na/Pi cotransporter family protein [Beduini massiliensis]